MKKIISLVASLTIISGVCAAVLAYVNCLTKVPIAEMKVKQEQDAVKAVLPQGAVKIEKASKQVDGKDVEYYVGFGKDGKVVGYAARGSDKRGYGGLIELMVGFLADKKTVECYKTLVASETPGLGMNMNSPEFVGQFKGKDATNLKVKQDPGGTIEAITAATITSRAVCYAIADARGKL
jgi:electron transport complex protein RnfG